MIPVSTFNNIYPLPIWDVTTYDLSTDESGSTYKTQSWEVSGKGLVFATGWHITGTTSDTCTSVVYIKHNSTIIARDYNRVSSAITEEVGCACTGVVYVSPGDKIHIYQESSKNGSKKYYYHIVCLGCKLTKI